MKIYLLLIWNWCLVLQLRELDQCQDHLLVTPLLVRVVLAIELADSDVFFLLNFSLYYVTSYSDLGSRETSPSRAMGKQTAISSSLGSSPASSDSSPQRHTCSSDEGGDEDDDEDEEFIDTVEVNEVSSIYCPWCL